jgi:uncharacterized protein DUF6682
MARTVQDVLDRASVILQDVAFARYTSPQLLGFVNDAIIEARSVRPDLFVGLYLTDTPQVTVVTDPIPVSDQFFAAICYYVSGRAELRDDEFAVDGRAMTLMSAFTKKLVGGM